MNDDCEDPGSASGNCLEFERNVKKVPGNQRFLDTFFTFDQLSGGASPAPSRWPSSDHDDVPSSDR